MASTIEDDDYKKYYPEDLSGATCEEQHNLFEHMLMYIYCTERFTKEMWR